MGSPRTRMFGLSFESNEVVDTHQNPKPEGRLSNPSLWVQAMEETNGVARRLNDDFAKWPEVHVLTEHISGLTYWAAQRLIDRKRLTNEYRPRDEAIVLS